MGDDLGSVVSGERGFAEDKLTIPAEHVALVRSGAFIELGSTIEDMCEITTRDDRGTPDMRARWETTFARLDRARSLLIVVGWDARGHEHDIDIDLCAHRDVLLAALRIQVEAERGHAESLPGALRGRAHAYIVVLSSLIEQAEEGRR